MEMKKIKRINVRDIVPHDYTWEPPQKVKDYTFDIPEPNQFELDIWEISDTLTNLLIKKHADYGPKNISQSPGGPLNGLRVRMWDKVARINNLIDTGKDAKNESLEDSFADLANYSIIALMVLKGKWPTE
jgi:hypothetical protein